MHAASWFSTLLLEVDGTGETMGDTARAVPGSRWKTGWCRRRKWRSELSACSDGHSPHTHRTQGAAFGCGRGIWGVSLRRRPSGMDPGGEGRAGGAALVLGEISAQM